MSQRQGSRVIRPHAEDEPELWPGTDYQHTPGQTASSEELPSLTEAERKQLRKERKARLAKRRPCGFAPWPDTLDP